MEKKISVAIDGPAGAGKSTIARRLAAELGYRYVDTGAIYRTVVLPKATVKIFLTASPEVRAERRCKELQKKGQKAQYAQILKEIQQRDYQDTHREIAPLKMCRDSVKVDTSDLNLEESVAAIRKIIEEKLNK